MSKDAFEFQTGIYGGTVVPKVQFADLSQIRMIAETTQPVAGDEHKPQSDVRNEVGGELRVPMQ